MGRIRTTAILVACFLFTLAVSAQFVPKGEAALEATFDAPTAYPGQVTYALMTVDGAAVSPGRSIQPGQMLGFQALTIGGCCYPTVTYRLYRDATCSSPVWSKTVAVGSGASNPGVRVVAPAVPGGTRLTWTASYSDGNYDIGCGRYWVWVPRTISLRTPVPRTPVAAAFLATNQQSPLADGALVNRPSAIVLRLSSQVTVPSGSTVTYAAFSSTLKGSTRPTCSGTPAMSFTITTTKAGTPPPSKRFILDSRGTYEFMVFITTPNKSVGMVSTTCGSITVMVK